MTIDVVPIRLASRWILVRAAVVSEFLSGTSWLSVPGATPLVPGVMTWRGRAIPVLDLPRALGLGAIAPQEGRSRVMIVEHAGGAIAIPVDGAREVKTLDEADVEPPHVSTTPYAAGEVDSNGEVLSLVELEQVLKEVGKANV